MLNHKKALIDIFVSPANLFASLKNSPTALLPFMCVAVTWALIMIWYFQAVDYDWYVDSVISTAESKNLTESELSDIRKNYANISPMVQGVITAVVVFLWITATYLLFSLYFVIVSAIKKDGFRFRDWFAFVNWSHMPAFLAVLAAAASILFMKNGQLRLDQLDPTTLNNLWFNLGDSSKFKSILDLLSITFIWTVVLMIIGYRQWTKSSIAVSSLTVISPILLAYGTWTLVTIYRA